VSAVFFQFLFFVSASGYPDHPRPLEVFVGASFQAFPQSEENSGVVDTRHTKLATVGLPFRLTRIEMKNYDGRLQLIAFPQIHVNEYVVMMDVGLGPQLVMPFGSYNSFPGAFLFELTGGFHTAILYDLGTLKGEDGTQLRSTDRYSYAAFMNFATGPEFNFADNMGYRFRLNAEVFAGQLSPYTSRTTKTKFLGLLLGIQGQFVF